MRFRKTVVIPAISLIIIFLGILSYFLFTQDDNDNNQKKPEDNNPLQDRDPYPDKKVSEMTEQELIQTVASWDGHKKQHPIINYKTEDMAEKANKIEEYRKNPPVNKRTKKIFDAINKLGEMRSEKAIPVLFDKIHFAYMSPESIKICMGYAEIPPFEETYSAVIALRKIGRKAAFPIITRISELDPDNTKENSEIFRLEQSLLGIHDLSKEEAVNLLKKEAEKADDKKVKERLLLAASKMESMAVAGKKND